MSAPDPAEHSLLVVIDPVARGTDGESVRIAKDVLCAGAATKICFPDGPEEYARALARLGHRRPVVIGDDRALLRVVALLHKERELARVALSVVPVGAPSAVALTRALGVPTDAVAAARAVLDGEERALDLLSDDSGGIVLGDLAVPAGAVFGLEEGAGAEDFARMGPYGGHGGHPGYGQRDGLEGAGRGEREPGEGTSPDGSAAPSGPGGEGPGAARRGRRDGACEPWWTPPLRSCRSFVRTLTRPLPVLGSAGGSGAGGGRAGERRSAYRLRVEADGVLLADLDRPVAGVSVSTAGPLPAAEAGTGEGPKGGLARVVVRPAPGAGPKDGGADDDAALVVARARAVTVSGADFRYRADTVVGGPVRTRTWTVQPGAWRLTLPRK